MDESLKTNNFDLLRILAALQVVVSHGVLHLGLARPSWWPWVEAFPGVPVFFAMSGFLISASYERSSSLDSYLRNRALRIFPGLWCCIILTVAVAAAFGIDFLSLGAVFWFVCQLIGAIFTPSFLRSFGFGSYNGSLWTIPIELQFYFLLPVLYFFLKRMAKPMSLMWAAVIAFSLVALICRAYFPPLDDVEDEPLAQKLLRYSFAPHVYLFLVGIILQQVKAFSSPWIKGKGLWWLGSYIAFYYLVPWSEPVYVLRLIWLGVASISIAYTLPTLSNKLLRGNDLSYGVYIYHGLLINVLVELGQVGHPSMLLILIVATVAVAYLSWNLVEKPFLRRKRRAFSPIAA